MPRKDKGQPEGALPDTTSADNASDSLASNGAGDGAGEGAVAKPRRWRAVVRFALVTLVLMLVAVLVSPFIYLHRAGGPKGLIESQLAQRLGSATVTVADVGFEVRLPSMFFTIVADEVDIVHGDSALTVPRASAVFSPRSLFTLRPLDVILSGLDVDITLSDDGWQGSPAAGLIAGLATQANAEDVSDTEGPRRVVVELATITVRKPATGLQPLRFTDVGFEFTAGSGLPLTGAIQAIRIIDDAPAGGLAATMRGDVESRDLSLDVRVDGLVAEGLLDFLPQIPKAVSDVGQLSGQISLGLSGQDIYRAMVDMVAVDGSIDASPMLGRLEYDTASLGLSFDQEAGSLGITQTELVLRDGRTLQFSGDVADINSAKPRLSAKLRGNRLPLDQLYADWPANMAADAKSFLQQRFQGGRLSDLTLEFSGGFERATSKLDVVSLDLRSSLSGVGVNVGGGQYEQFTGVADGNMVMRLGAGAVVEELAVAMGVSGGSLVLRDQPAPMALDRFQMTAALEGDGLSVEDISLSLADGGAVGVSGLIELGDGWAIEGANLTMVANSIDVGSFHAIWPEWLVTRTRSWVGEKIPHAEVEDVRLRFLTDFSGDRPRLTDMEGHITLRDAQLALSDRLPVFTDIDGRIQIADNRAEMILTDGEVNDLTVRNGRVVIQPVIGGGAKATTDIDLTGDFGDAFDVAKAFGFGGGDAAMLNNVVASGKSELAVQTTLPIRRKLTATDIDISVEATLMNGDLSGLPFGAQARDATLQIKADRDRFDVAGNAHIFDLPSDVKFAWAKAGVAGNAGPVASLQLGANGDLQHLADVAARLGLTSFAGFDLTEIDMEGTADVLVRLDGPIRQGVRFSDLDVQTDLLIHDARFENLPIVDVAENAELVAQFSRDISEVSGAATAFGVPVDFALRADRKANNLTVQANAPRAAGMTDFVGKTSGLDVSGKIGGSVKVATSLDRKIYDVELDVDLNETGVSVPAIGWAKLPAEEGQASMRLLIEGGGLVAIQNLMIEAGSLVADGDLAFTRTDDGSTNLSEARFTELTWPGNDITSVAATRDAQGMWLINAEAKQIDLVPLRRNQGPGEGQAVRFDILADQIILGDGLILSGHINGGRELAGTGRAEFSGALFYNDRPIFTESQVLMNFGSDGETLHGKGIIGGAETSLTYLATNGSAAELTMVSQNGGRVLTGLGITDTIRSGEMLLKTTFVDGYENFDTTIRITNFRVVEAPTAVRAFSVLAPSGLLGLVEGEGTAFNWGEALLQRRGSTINLNQVTGQGQAVSVAFVGQYDQDTRQVDVSGNLVPASFLSRVIGVIPLVGEILTGIDNAGLFVTQFSVKGDVDDPETSVTPASIIPGVLRDLFSPDWLRREGDRILGPTANGYATDN